MKKLIFLSLVFSVLIIHMVSSEYPDGGDSCEGCNPPPTEDDDDDDETLPPPSPVDEFLSYYDEWELGIYGEETTYQAATNTNTTADLSAAGGDPVRIATGFFTTRETDISYQFGDLKVQITRIYQSDRSWSHGFGPGWNFTYETRIIRGVRPKAEEFKSFTPTNVKTLPRLIEEKIEAAECKARLAFLNDSKNKYVLNAADPGFLRFTGNNTLTLIDEE